MPRLHRGKGNGHAVCRLLGHSLLHEGEGGRRDYSSWKASHCSACLSGSDQVRSTGEHGPARAVIIFPLFVHLSSPKTPEESSRGLAFWVRLLLPCCLRQHTAKTSTENMFTNNRTPAYMLTLHTSRGSDSAPKSPCHALTHTILLVRLSCSTCTIMNILQACKNILSGRYLAPSDSKIFFVLTCLHDFVSCLRLLLTCRAA
jgi:hypothetical protein